MTAERWATLAERLALALVVTMHALVIVASPWISGWPQVLQSLIPFCQLTLLLGCLFLVPLRSWLQRSALVVALVAAPVAWFWMWRDRTVYSNELEVPMLVGCGVLLGMVFAGARYRGWRVVPSSCVSDVNVSGWQFSIRTLLVLTTVVAASVALLEGVRPLLEPGVPDKAQWSFTARWVYDSVEDIARPPAMRIYVLCVAIAGISAGCGWAMLGQRAVWLRLLIVSLGTAASGVYLAQIIHGLFLFGIAIALSQYLALLAGTLLPLRLWNVRLTRRKLSSAGTKPDPVAAMRTIAAPTSGSTFAPGHCAKSEVGT